MTNHPITPPPELVEQWEVLPLSLAFEAAYRAGADAELEACCDWLNITGRWDLPAELRTARRPKPPSLKEQSLAALRHILNHSSTELGADTIRRALEQLDE